MAEDFLSKIDLMNMATLLETHVPYLDNKVVTLSASMPGRLKWLGFKRKYLLKKAYENEIPHPILARSEKKRFHYSA